MSRAFRFLGELEMDRLDYSLSRWRSLEEGAGHPMFVRTGLLNLGPPGDSELERFMAVLRDSERPHEWLGSKELATRFPMLNYPQRWGAAFDPNGGILIAHRCLSAVQSRFAELGGSIVTGHIEAVEPRAGGGVRIAMRSDASGGIEEQHSDRAVICAGPWTGKLLPQLDGLLHCVRTPVTYWSDPTGSYSAASGFPIVFNARLTGVYGLPSYEYPGLAKVLFHGGPISDPDTRDLAAYEPYIRKVRDYVQEHLHLLDGRRPAILESCMYTMSPDSNPIIDRLASDVVVGCGFSGSGFKHAPATGWMLAALALEQDETIPQGFRSDRYTLDRFPG